MANRIDSRTITTTPTNRPDYSVKTFLLFSSQKTVNATVYVCKTDERGFEHSPLTGKGVKRISIANMDRFNQKKFDDLCLAATMGMFSDLVAAQKEIEEIADSISL